MKSQNVGIQNPNPNIIYEKEMYRVLTFQFVEIQEVFTLNFQLIFLELNYQISPIW